MARLNVDADGISRVLPYDAAMRLFDASQERPFDRIRAIEDAAAFARRVYPRFFYSEKQAAERSRLYSLELERRRSRDGERVDG